MELLDSLSNAKELSFFCGAGISYNSGIPLVYHIVRDVIDALSDKQINPDEFYTNLITIRKPFEAFMETLLRTSRNDTVLDIFDSSSPNNNHRIIAQLCKRGIVREVFTTNFDTLLETAFNEINLLENVDYVVLSQDDQFSLDYGPNIIVLYKIHGCISQKKTMSTTIKNVANKYKVAKRKKVIERAFLPNRSGRTMIVLGYSFSDVFDINIFINEMEINKNENTYIIKHTQELNNQYSICSFHDSGIELLTSLPWKGSCINMQTEYFMSQLAHQFDLELRPKEEKLPSNSPSCYFSQMPTFKKKYMLASLLLDIGKRDDALALIKSGIELSEAPTDFSTFDLLRLKALVLVSIGGKENVEKSYEAYDELLERSLNAHYITGIAGGLLGKGSIVLREYGNYAQAKGYYTKAVNTLENGTWRELEVNSDLPKLKEEILAQLYSGLASCYRHEMKQDKSLKNYTKSLFVRLNNGDLSGEARCYHGIGNVFCDFYLENNNDWYFAKSEWSYRKFDSITTQIGDVFYNASARYCLSRLYVLRGPREEYNKAWDYCQLCLEVRSINKNKEFGDALFLESKISFLLGKNDESREKLCKVRDFRHKINDEIGQLECECLRGLMSIQHNDSNAHSIVLSVIEAYHDKRERMKLYELRNDLGQLKVTGDFQISRIASLHTKINKFLNNY